MHSLSLDFESLLNPDGVRYEAVLSFFPHDRIWAIDGEPDIMVLFEKVIHGSSLLKYASGGISIMSPSPEISMFANKNSFTHRPRIVRDTFESRMDLFWFISRYDNLLYITDEDKEYLASARKEYISLKKELSSKIDDYTPPKGLEMALPLRPYQVSFLNVWSKRNSLLLADQVGIGKTPQAIGALSLEGRLPALVIVPPTLMTQWVNEIKKFLPELSTHVIKSRQSYELPSADIYICAYTRLQGWGDLFGDKDLAKSSKGLNHIKTVVMDEVHELRNATTNKYVSAKGICQIVPYKLGLSATPIDKYGEDIFNIINILFTGEPLGNLSSFMREWCSYDNGALKLRNPKLFGHYLRKNVLMMRRTRDDINMYLDPISKTVVTVDSDMETLHAIQKDAQALSVKILTGGFEEAGQAARELDYLMRHATGLAKAKQVCEIVKNIVMSGEKVVLFGWHRDVYDVWLKELEAYNPVMYTGSESTPQKNASLEKFISDDTCMVFIMSLASGKGLNGLQEVASTAVFGELSWSPAEMDQCLGRLWRDGQKNTVQGIFVTIPDGSDPIMIEKLGVKRSIARGVTDPASGDIGVIAGVNISVKELAKAVLDQKGISVTPRREHLGSGLKKIEASGKEKNPHSRSSLGDQLLHLLKGKSFNTFKEDDMQNEVDAILAKNMSYFGENPHYAREVIHGKADRYDFVVSNQNELVIIECKVSDADKKDTLRQLKRYVKNNENIKEILLVCPWHVHDFYLTRGEDDKAVKVLIVNNVSSAF